VEILQSHKVLLYAPGAHKPVEDRNASGLIVRSTRACTTKRLLANDGTRALLVVVHVTSRVAETVGSCQKRLAVASEAGFFTRLDMNPGDKSLLGTYIDPVSA
jgi:hypothetical protein